MRSNNKLFLSMRNIYSTLLIKTHSVSILIDPIGITPEKYSDIDILIITHEHIDHFDKNIVKNIFDYSNCIILTSSFVARQLKDLNKIFVQKPGDLYKIKDINIYFEHCRHTANNPLSFVVKNADFSIFHPGDSDFFPEMSLIKDKYEPDIMIYNKTSQNTLNKMSSVIKSQFIICLKYPMINDFAVPVPDTDIIMLNPLEWFIFS